jgi:hypothetical protein
MRNSAYLTEARERDRRKGNLSTRNNNNLHDSVSDKDEYDMGASNCAAAVVVYVVVYAVVHAVVHAVYKRWRKKAASSAQKHNAVATSLQRYDALMLRRYDALTLRCFDATTLRRFDAMTL